MSTIPITGIVDIMKNPVHGGTGGTTFSISDDLIAVQTITVWVGPGSGTTLVLGIKVDWTDGKSRSKGNTSNTNGSSSFKFDEGEKVTSMSLWTGDRVDRLLMKTDGDNTFDQGGTGGTEQPQGIGNGILLGFQGSYDSNELVSLGSIFKQDSD
jgi:hypothetical protein